MPVSAKGLAVRLPEALLYDSEASLRLVDNALEELRESKPHRLGRVHDAPDHFAAGPDGRGELMASLRQELHGITHRLQLENVTSEQLGHIASLLHRVTEVMAGIPHTAAHVGALQHDV